MSFYDYVLTDNLPLPLNIQDIFLSEKIVFIPQSDVLPCAKNILPFVIYGYSDIPPKLFSG